MNIWTGIGYLGGFTVIAVTLFGLPALDRHRRRSERGPDRPGQFLTSLDDHNNRAVQAGLVDELQLPLRQAAPGSLTDAERALWSDLEARVRTPYFVPLQRTELQP